jgi:serine/threonine protein kinase
MTKIKEHKVPQGYTFVKKVGSGTFGSVYKCISEKTGETVAVKAFKKKFKSEEVALGQAEVQIL